VGDVFGDALQQTVIVHVVATITIELISCPILVDPGQLSSVPYHQLFGHTIRRKVKGILDPATRVDLVVAVDQWFHVPDEAVVTSLPGVAILVDDSVVYTS
jgi:hypothetical protein